MRQTRENALEFKAGVLSVAVHGVLLLALFISFDWKVTHPITITTVELWDALPEPSPAPEPAPVPVPVPEVVKEPVKIEPPPTPVPEPKAEIVVQEKPVKKPPPPVVKAKKNIPLPEKKSPDRRLEVLQKEFMQDELQLQEKKLEDEALKKLQQDSLAEEKSVADQRAHAAKSAVNASIVDEYRSKIQAKVRAHVNKTLCAEGNPQLVFEVNLLPTGELGGPPKLLRASGHSACDDAVERAIIASQPLPLPSEPALFTQFRNLKLTFRPNEG